MMGWEGVGGIVRAKYRTSDPPEQHAGRCAPSLAASIAAASAAANSCSSRRLQAITVSAPPPLSPLACPVCSHQAHPLPRHQAPVTVLQQIPLTRLRWGVRVIPAAARDNEKILISSRTQGCLQVHSLFHAATTHPETGLCPSCLQQIPVLSQPLLPPASLPAV